MTSGSLLARNTFFNLAGQGIPLLVAIFAIPVLINGLGLDRFGVLTLAWMVIGYFSLFDLGLGRALTKLVAEKLGCAQEDEIPALVWTCLLLMLMLGVIGAVVLGLFTPWLVHRILKIPEELQPETLQSFYLLAITIPVIISTAGLRGILEALQRFGIINAVRIPQGMFAFLGPLLVLPFSHNLFPIVVVLTIIRLVTWIVYMLLCLHVLPALKKDVVIKRYLMGPMMRFGSWITVSNIVGPLMVYLDRFLIGAWLSMAAVAYYVIPYELVTKVLIIPDALVRVIFPAFATSFVQDHSRTTLLFGKSIKYILLALFPITLIIVTLGEEGLNLWLGKEFAQNSTRVLQWLAIGVFINSLAQLPFALIQGLGRPDLTAKLHLIELPFYLLIFWWLISTYGIEGAAIAWLARVTVDTIILFGMSYFLLSKSAIIIQRMTLAFLITLLIMGFAMLPMTITMKVIFLMVILSTFAILSWFLILSPEERMLLQNRLKTSRVYK